MPNVYGRIYSDVHWSIEWFVSGVVVASSTAPQAFTFVFAPHVPRHGRKSQSWTTARISLAIPACSCSSEPWQTSMGRGSGQTLGSRYSAFEWIETQDTWRKLIERIPDVFSITNCLAITTVYCYSIRTNYMGRPAKCVLTDPRSLWHDDACRPWRL